MENQNQPSGTREISPVERGISPNEVPMPEQKTGDVPPSPSPGRTSLDNQESGRDTQEDGKWDSETR